MIKISKQHILTVSLSALLFTGWSAVPSAQADSLQLQATDDTYIKNTAPLSNFGNFPSGATRHQLELYHAGATETQTLLKFDLSAIPDGAQITGATLSLHTRGNPTRATNLELYRNSNDNWYEDTATWYNYYTPEHETTLLSSVNEVTELQYYTWNLNIAEWNYGMDLNDDALSFILKFGLPGNPKGRLARFHSSEVTTPYPLLDIQYTYAPEPVSTVLFLSGAPLLGFGMFRKKRP
ncbi:MAG: DNRLRE domain-containing protein [Candidatus Omnitrophica bacterium]|nr:DNRLRE domain-containing protein [Candidatus Omnitrophota bacterium]